MYLGNAIVVFADMLGFSSLVEKNWENASKFVNTVIDLKEFMRNFDYPKVGIVGKEFISKPFIGTISDSFVLVFPTPDNLHGLQASYCAASMCSSVLALVASRHGFAIRGGAEFGSIYWDENNNIIGPALGHAYHVESKIAKKARIVVGPRLLSTILENPTDGMAPFSWASYVTSDQLIAFRPSNNPEYLNNIDSIKQGSPEEQLYRYDEIVMGNEESAREIIFNRSFWVSALDRLGKF